MPELSIPWRPRVIMPDRSFRLPVSTEGNDIGLDTSDFELIDSRWDGRDATRYYYLRSPSTPGDYKVMVGCGKKVVSTVIR